MGAQSNKQVFFVGKYAATVMLYHTSVNLSTTDSKSPIVYNAYEYMNII